MNRPKSWTLVLALSLFVPYAAADNPTAAQPLPDPNLAVYAKPQLLIELRDKRRIHFFCLGSGTPTVILTAGLGDWAAIWSNVQAPIALKTRVCAWDRAGFGYSDPSSAPQDVSHTTADLEEALQSSEIDGPYVLVGHSLGAYESLLFADRHPGQVLGMVLVDPAFPDQARRVKLVAPKYYAPFRKFLGQQATRLKKCAAALKSGRLTTESPDPDNCFDYPPSFPPELKAALIRLDESPARRMTEASTWEQFPRSSLIVLNPERNYRSMPIRVLTRSEFFSPDMPADVAAEVPSFIIEWRRAHDAIAALSTDGINTTVEGSRHYIQKDKPAVVISTVDEVIDKVRAKPVASQRP